jgi:uncharacterized protein YaaW (UPF0174 family)
MMSIEEQEDLLQAMSAKELRALIAQGEWKIFQSMSVKELLELEKQIEWKIYHNDVEKHYDVDTDYALTTSMVQEAAAPSLKKLLSLSEKATKTGLTQEQILLIETDKSKASLSEIMHYCKGLGIEYADFLPELF